MFHRIFINIFFHIWTESREYPGIFHGILSVPQNIILDVNNVMYVTLYENLN